MAEPSEEMDMRFFEIEMMQKVFSNMTKSCLKKCIPPRYQDGELTKGESVCLDRCSAKFMEAYLHTAKTLGTLNNPGLMPS